LTCSLGVTSAKSNLGFEKPFIFLLRKLTNEPNAHFVEAPALLPPEITIDPKQIEANNLALDEANITPLPADADEDL